MEYIWVWDLVFGQTRISCLNSSVDDCTLGACRQSTIDNQELRYTGMVHLF